MVVEKVNVGGEMPAVWAHLLTTLQANRYEIEQQIPCSHVSARRGKKLSNLLLSTPRYGFRELDVDLYPSGRNPRDTEVTFKFVFPAYGVPPGRRSRRTAEILSTSSRDACGASLRRPGGPHQGE